MKGALGEAAAAVDEMLSAERCAALVEAVVTKYVALSPEELQEWQVGWLKDDTWSCHHNVTVTSSTPSHSDECGLGHYPEVQCED